MGKKRKNERLTKRDSRNRTDRKKWKSIRNKNHTKLTGCHASRLIYEPCPQVLCCPYSVALRTCTSIVFS